MNEWIRDILAQAENRFAQSAALLHDSLGKQIQRIACHHLPGVEDGRFRDTVEICLGDASLYFRAPIAQEHGRISPPGLYFVYREFVSQSPPDAPWDEDPGYQLVTDEDVELWRAQRGKQIVRVDLLVNLARGSTEGIRFILEDRAIMNYHFQWGESPGDLVSAEIGLTCGERVVPDNIHWLYVPWICRRT